MAPSPEHWASPITTRSQVVLEIASELVDTYDATWQAKVLLRVQGEPEWATALYGSSTIDGVHAVVNGEAALAIVNPSTTLALAYRGVAPFEGPQPVRTIGVIPSWDQYVFAVRPETGLRFFEEIGEKQAPLRVSMRAIPDHSLHLMLEHIMTAAGFDVTEFLGWGGELRREGSMPWKESAKFRALVAGEIDAIFDEASTLWLNEAIEAGMTILSLRPATVERLEQLGFRRGVLAAERFPSLDRDILTVDFSGWPIFVRSDAPDRLVTAICAALERRKGAIGWQGDGPLPVERMCIESRDTPQDVPLHPSAQRFWAELGYLQRS